MEQPMREFKANICVPAFLLESAQCSLQISPTLGVDQKKPSQGEKQPAEPTLSTSRTGETTKIEGQDTPASKGAEKSSPAKKDGGEKKVIYWQRVTSPDVLPNWNLMVVGVAGMSVGLITLALIYGQRKDTQRALEYARQSADAAYKSAQASFGTARLSSTRSALGLQPVLNGVMTRDVLWGTQTDPCLASACHQK
jgi:hypothetical protein